MTIIDQHIETIKTSLADFEITFEKSYEDSKVLVVKEGTNEVDIVFELEGADTLNTNFYATENTPQIFVQRVMDSIIHGFSKG